MTEKLTIENYNGIPVRVVNTDIGRAIPAVDIAKSLGCSRKNITQIMNENPHLFTKGVTTTYPLPTGGGVQDHVCLNEDALVSLLMRVHVGKSGTLEGKARIEKFQVWARDTLSAAIKNGGVHKRQIAKEVAPKRRSPASIAKDGLAFCRVTHSDPKETLGRMLIEEGYAYLPALLPPSHILLPSGVGQRSFAKSQTTLAVPERPLIETIAGKDLVPPSPKPGGMLSATDIGRIIGKTAEQVNQWLYNNKYIVMDGERKGEWRITELGKQYGKESDLYKPHPAAQEVYRVFWNREILEKFNVKVPNA